MKVGEEWAKIFFKSLYAESGNGDDMEMLLLDNAYDQLVAGRWIIE